MYISEDTVRFSIHLSKEGVEALENLQELLLCETLEETVKRALAAYGVEVRNCILKIDD